MSDKFRAIRNEADYDAALARIGALMDTKKGTPEGDGLDVLTDLSNSTKSAISRWVIRRRSAPSFFASSS